MRQGGGDVGISPGMGAEFLLPSLFLLPPLETSPWEGFHAISNLTAARNVM